MQQRANLLYFAAAGCTRRLGCAASQAVPLSPVLAREGHLASLLDRNRTVLFNFMKMTREYNDVVVCVGCVSKVSTVSFFVLSVSTLLSTLVSIVSIVSTLVSIVSTQCRLCRHYLCLLFRYTRASRIDFCRHEHGSESEERRETKQKRRNKEANSNEQMLESLSCHFLSAIFHYRHLVLHVRNVITTNRHTTRGIGLTTVAVHLRSAIAELDGFHDTPRQILRRN